MEIVPIKQEYTFAILNHTMRAVAEHRNGNRYLNYYFDQKLVAEKILPGGDYYTDDDCIREVVEDYRKNHVGVYADIFNHHTDKIKLTAKLLEAELINNGIKIHAKVKIVKDCYEIDLATESGMNQFGGKFQASDFSEVLEKMRLFTNVMAGVNDNLAQHINLLSNDKVEELIKWQE